MKIAVIPIDNRPICYDLISDILFIDNNIELFMPDIKDLGGLKTHCNVDNILSFIEKLPIVDSLIVCLDTVAYGGLISSRRIDDSFDEIKERIEKFKKIASKKTKKILAFSSIMRISNNNINEEEKIYWSQYGKKIFSWSYELHKKEVLKLKDEIKNEIPKEILEDYLNTRKRNFKINEIYLNWAKEGFFDTLIFSKDDCAEFGLNIKEANFLADEIKKHNLKNVKIKTGADEIPLGLISRAINQDVKFNPIFIEENSIDLISKYEDISIKNCVLGQIELSKSIIDTKNYDINLIINNFKAEQGDLVLGSVINTLNKKIDFNFDIPFAIADVNNANGSDKGLVEQLFNINTNNFYGYCAYNTSANTIGCTILAAIVKFLALRNNSYSDLAFKKLQFIRFMDDWVYQAIVRKFVRENAPLFQEKLKEKIDELNNYSKEISKFLNYYPDEIDYSLPWDRSFEIRIKVK